MSIEITAISKPVAEMERLGNEIAELSAHLEAAGAHLLDLIREFDARGGWNHGFSSCAQWLSWRIGLDPGAARERVRVARANKRVNEEGAVRGYAVVKTDRAGAVTGCRPFSLVVCRRERRRDAPSSSSLPRANCWNSKL